MSNGYIVVRMVGKDAIPIHHGYNERIGDIPEGMEPTIHQRVRDAEPYLSYYKVAYGNNYQIRPYTVENIDWRKRELERLESGHYIKLPWHNEGWVSRNETCKDHFAHVAKANPALIAYTADENKALRDLKSVLRPARYLHLYYRDILTETAIREWVGKYKKLHDPSGILYFAQDRKDIKRVYLNGPHSCMSKTIPCRAIHASEAYAGPDLAIAYATKDQRIIARTVCWPKKKIYSRIYGDADLLRGLLEDEGYEQHWDREGYDDAFIGARLTKIVHNNRFVCPYIDGYFRVRVGKKYLTINPKGKWACQNQDGYCGTPFECRNCHQIYDMAKIEQFQVNGTYWCETCFNAEKQNLSQCDHLLFANRRLYSNRWFTHDRMVRMGTGELWLKDHANNIRYAFVCDSCRLLLPNRMGSKHHQVYDRYSGVNYYNRCHDCATRQGELPV